MSINLAQTSHGCTGLTNALICVSNHITNWPSPWSENSFTRIDGRYFDVLHPTDGIYFDIRVIKNMKCSIYAYAKSCISGNTYLYLNGNTEIVASTGPSDVRTYNEILHLKSGDYFSAKFTNQGQIIRYDITWICDE